MATVSTRDQDVIAAYLTALDQRLTGPRRLRRDLLTEVRDSLVDATEAHRSAGLPEGAAAHQALAEFGSPGRLAPSYQIELAAGAARRLALIALVIPIGAIMFGDQMWRGAPWAVGEPSPVYALVARSMDTLTYIFAAAALLALLALRRQARTGADPRLVCRLLGIGALITLGVTTTLGSALWVGAAVVHPAVLSYPPMLIGGVVLLLVDTAQFVVGLRSLAVTRAARRLTLESVAVASGTG